MTSVESKTETWKRTEGHARGVADSTVELLELLGHVQGGRMEEQRCYFDPKKIPCNPKHTEASNRAPSSGTRPQEDPGSHWGGQKTETVNETDRLCNMVSKVQDSRMEEQRCSAPQVFLAPGSPSPPRRAHSRPASPTAAPSSQAPPRSASLSPSPEKERAQRSGLQTAQQEVAPSAVDLERFLSLLSHVQRGCMEEQRCVFDPNKSSCSSKHSQPTRLVPTPGSTADIDQLFSILASTQSRRLDDQRVSLNLLPGLQAVSGSDLDGQMKSVAGKETDELCSVVSRVQGSRMEEQRCSAPQVFLAFGSPSPPRRAHSRPASPAPSSQGPPRSASLSPSPGKERAQRDGLQTAQQEVAPSAVDLERFFSLLSHVQRGCMEEQRCVFDPNKKSTGTSKHPDATNSVLTHTATADIDQLFSILASTQSRRLDDQRVSLNLLPGLQAASGSNQDGQMKLVAGKETDELCSMVSRVQGCRIDEQRCSLPVTLSPGPPRSASMNGVAFDPALPRQGQLLSAPNLALPRKARSNPSSPNRATPRKTRSRPNSPGRATPRKSRSRPSSPGRVTPRKSRSRPNSPGRATPRKSRSRPLSLNMLQHVSSPIGPDEDCFSLIHRVHASQLQMGEGDKGAHGSKGMKWEKGGEKRGRGEGGKREGKREVEEKEGRGKEKVRNEKKAGGRKK